MTDRCPECGSTLFALRGGKYQMQRPWWRRLLGLPPKPCAVAHFGTCLGAGCSARLDFDAAGCRVVGHHAPALTPPTMTQQTAAGDAPLQNERKLDMGAAFKDQPFGRS